MHHGKLTKNVAKGLKVLRQRIARAEIPASKLDESLNVATWNVREFGKRRRKKASLHYIAEIINQFDLVAITEVRDDLSDLKQVLDYLGGYWRVVYSDFNTDAGGNRERVAYVYDKRMCAFTGLAAEADPPRKKDKATGEYLSKISWWRSPYMASFRAGAFDFVLLTTHVRWGSGEDARIAPLTELAKWVDKRRSEKHVVDRDFIVMGDFNIPAIDDDLFKAITSKGLKIPAALRGPHGSNLARDKRYDQILHSPTNLKRFTNHAGALDFYAGSHKPLFPGDDMTKLDFTFQLSDHLPLWIQIDCDVEGETLDQFLG